MRAFARKASEDYSVGPVTVVRWEQYALGDALPFGAMWYVVPPGRSAPPDRHPDAELSLVLSGTASVEADGTITEVEHGSAFLLDGDEPHTVHNRGTEPLLVFSAYWIPGGTDE